MNSPFVGGFGLTSAEHFLWKGCSIPRPPVRWADAKPLISPSSVENTAEHQAATAIGAKAEQNVQYNYCRLLNLPSIHSKVAPVLNNLINISFLVFRLKLN